MPAFTLEAWVRPLIAEENGDGLRLLCPSQFHRDRLRDRFLGRISECAAEEAGRPVKVEFAVSDRAGGKPDRRRPGGRGDPPRPRARSAAPSARGRRPGAPRRPARPAAPARRPSQRAFPYTFDSFVVGPCNALAREAALAVARGEQETLNLLYLKSDTGLGKTHLARAIVSESRANGQPASPLHLGGIVHQRLHAVDSQQADGSVQAALPRRLRSPGRRGRAVPRVQGRDPARDVPHAHPPARRRRTRRPHGRLPAALDPRNRPAPRLADDGRPDRRARDARPPRCGARSCAARPPRAASACPTTASICWSSACGATCATSRAC